MKLISGKLKGMLVMLSALMAVGCSISNEDIIKAVKLCKDAGLKPVMLYRFMGTGEPAKVICMLPDEQITKANPHTAVK